MYVYQEIFMKNTKRITIEISNDAHRMLKIQAAEQDTTMQYILIRWIYSELSKNPEFHEKNQQAILDSKKGISATRYENTMDIR